MFAGTIISAMAIAATGSGLATSNQPIAEPAKQPAVSSAVIADWWGYDITITGTQCGREMPIILASCSRGGTGGKCKISQTVSMSGSISASGGVDSKVIKAETGVTISGSVSQTIEAESPTMTTRQMFIARPQGTFYFFDWSYYKFGQKVASGKGTAFQPTGVAFRVVPR